MAVSCGFEEEFSETVGSVIGEVKKERFLAVSVLFDELDRRIRRMEDVVTSKDYTWKQKFDRM